MKESKLYTVTMVCGNQTHIFDFIDHDLNIWTFIDDGELIKSTFANRLFYEMIYKQEIESCGVDGVKVSVSL